jgi:hypothetical protein
MKEILRDELTGIFLRRGRLTAAVVVEEAAPADSPLHDEFTWDDAEAGHQYRLVQARALIRSVRIRVIDADPKSETIRAFVHVPSAGRESTGDSDDGAPPVDAGYLPVEDVGQSDRLRTIALSQMEREWRLFRRRWQQYAEFWALIKDAGTETG